MSHAGLPQVDSSQEAMGYGESDEGERHHTTVSLNNSLGMMGKGVGIGSDFAILAKWISSSYTVCEPAYLFLTN